VFSKYSVYQWDKPTALLIGEFTNFTDTNIKQVKDSIKEVGQVCLQISNTCSDGVFKARKENIKSQLNHHGISYNAKYTIMSVPHITLIVDNNALLQNIIPNN